MALRGASPNASQPQGSPQLRPERGRPVVTGRWPWLQVPSPGSQPAGTGLRPLPGGVGPGDGAAGVPGGPAYPSARPSSSGSRSGSSGRPRAPASGSQSTCRSPPSCWRAGARARPPRPAGAPPGDRASTRRGPELAALPPGSYCSGDSRAAPGARSRGSAQGWARVVPLQYLPRPLPSSPEPSAWPGQPASSPSPAPSSLVPSHAQALRLVVPGLPCHLNTLLGSAHPGSLLLPRVHCPASSLSGFPPGLVPAPSPLAEQGAPGPVSRPGALSPKSTVPGLLPPVLTVPAHLAIPWG